MGYSRICRKGIQKFYTQIRSCGLNGDNQRALTQFVELLRFKSGVVPTQQAGIITYRGGLANSDSAISDSLAQPKPWKTRQTEEQAHEKDEKESRTGIQGQGGLGSDQGRQDHSGVG